MALTDTSGEGEQLSDDGGWLDISSTSISSVAFGKSANDPERGDLRVKFTSGKIYEYKNLPAPLFRMMMYAGSPGNYLKKNVIPFYDGTEVKGE